MAKCTVIGVILVWTAVAGCSAEQQQQQAVLPSAMADDMVSIIARTVQEELRPIVRRLESRMESLDNRLSLLDSRVTELTVNLLRSSLGEQMDELSSQLTGITARLDHQQSQLTDLNTQLNSQKSVQNEVSVKMDNHTARLDSLASQVDILGSKLTVVINKTSSQQDIIEDPAATVDQLTPPRDCSDLPVDSPSGVYLLQPSGDSQQPPVKAYCDMDTVGGRWTVIQRRDDFQPRQNFYLGWQEYKKGFGNLTGEFWLGLANIRQLTSSNDRRHELRIELEAFDGSQRYALYQDFRISSELDGYTLSISNYTGTAGDGLQWQWSVNRKFSTRDRDQDGWPDGHCARRHRGAWWYGEWCELSSLNGRYLGGADWDGTGIWWWEWRRRESLKKTEMKIRRT
ncbi:microfibril-associated glycoprotein 4-like [Amphibalanus amphitrite]|uniref:microfibril-associated glycoprotein 4-like n=1 Tax=Amphibalanus amphitrite TaxID=1232801 RepID=UPI001C904996|nr:microfibril-associated glycoprotein 4-like [Amphibalanus amphitrite]